MRQPPGVSSRGTERMGWMEYRTEDGIEFRLPVPHPLSYWVMPGRFLAGAYPGSPDISETRQRMVRLLESGVRRVINLMEENELDRYGRLMTPYGEILCEIARDRGSGIWQTRMPVRDLGVPSTHQMKVILDEIDWAVSHYVPVYVHCLGGVGRTGTVVGCYLVRHGLSGDMALKRIAELRRNTPHGDYPSPETEVQRDMVRSWRERENGAG